jgi:beta-lactamase class A
VIDKHKHVISSHERHTRSSKVRVVWLFVTALVVATATFLVTKNAYSPTPARPPSPESLHADHSDYQIKRLANSRFIRPLFSAKPSNEYEGYAGIKTSVSNLIDYYKAKGTIASASFYMRDFDRSNWTAVNQDERFHPGSMLKIAVLMTILKQGEDHPGFLEETIPFTFRFTHSAQKKPSILANQIEFGKRYTHRELLKYMIEYSDNDASELLWMVMDKAMFARMFEDFGLPKPDMNKEEIPLSALECSIFMESLFNASYLSIRQSEYAIDLLSRSSFRDGIVRGIPTDKLLIAHKFGESGTDKARELHETGILYIQDRPYLITIMTKGKEDVDYPGLATVLQGISRTIYTGLERK